MPSFTHSRGKRLNFGRAGVVSITQARFASQEHSSTPRAHLPSAQLHSGFSSQLSHSAGSDMESDQTQLALPPEMILLIRISSGAGSTQHLLASAAASWVKLCRGEQTVPGRLSSLFSSYTAPVMWRGETVMRSAWLHRQRPRGKAVASHWLSLEMH